MGSNFEYCPRGVFDPCGNMLMQINSISESMVKYSQKMLKKHPNAPYVIYQASLIFFFKVWAPLVLWLVLLPADVTSCKGNVFEFCGSTYVQGTLKGVLGLNTTTLTLEDAFKEPSQYYPDLYPVPICEHNYSVIVWQEVLIDNKHATYFSADIMTWRLIHKGRKFSLFSSTFKLVTYQMIN